MTYLMYIRELLEPSLINRVLILNYQFNRRGMVGGMGAKGRGWKGTGAGMAAGAGCLGTVARV